MKALIDSGSEVNIMSLIYAKNPELHIRKTNIGAQKFDRLTLKTLKIVLAVFSLKNKLKWIQFFEKNFLIADMSIELILGMLFFCISNADIWFAKTKKLT